MNQTILHICATDAKDAITEGMDLHQRLAAAMGRAKDFWLTTDEDTRFHGAIVAVALTYPDGAPELQRLRRELDQLRALGAAIAGVPVDLGAVFTDTTDEPIGLVKMWKEAKAP